MKFQCFDIIKIWQYILYNVYYSLIKILNERLFIDIKFLNINRTQTFKSKRLK